MNEHKFCFIIYANAQRYLEECLWYIDKLNVPVGYETETIVIRDAVPVAAGYQQAMMQSDAKYKIYLRSEVLVVNPEILSELLEAFRESSIGMVGILGNVEEREIVSSEEDMVSWDAGTVEMCNVIDARKGSWFLDEEKKWVDVVEIAGMFMATQYDLSWDGIGECGSSYAMNMQQAGYRVVVPQIGKEKSIWVFLDAGQCGLGEENQSEEIKEGQKKAIRAFESGDFEETVRLIEELGLNHLNYQLAYIVLFLKVRVEELKTFGAANFPDAARLQAFICEYDEVKFMLRRIYFGYKDAAWRELCERIRAGQCSMQMVWQASQICVANQNRLWWDVFERYQEEIHTLMREGEISLVERFLLQMDAAWRGVEGNILVTLLCAYHHEMEKGISPTVFDMFREPEELTEHYIRLKYYMRRLEFGLPQEYWQEIYDYCIQTKVSDYLIFQILSKNIFYKEDLCRNLSIMFAQKESAESVRARFYAQLAQDDAGR